jgi:hypothetical protein
MHEANQPPFMHPFIAALQWVLLSTPVGRFLVQVTCAEVVLEAQPA